METIFIIISGIISIVGTVPYIRDILRGKTKPRIVSWFTWALLTGMAAAASFAEAQYPAAILTTCMTLGCVLVVILGLMKYGTVSFAPFDIVCQLLALVGLGLWWLYQSPAIALIVAVIVDCIASLPTLRHAWKAPHEETLFNFLMSGMASVITLCIAGDLALTAILYPLYLVVINFTTVCVIIVAGRKTAENHLNEVERL